MPAAPLHISSESRDILAQWQRRHSSAEAQQALAPRLEAAPVNIKGRNELARCFASNHSAAPRYTLFLMGDSTARNIYRAMCSLLDPVEWKVINDTSLDKAHLTCSGRFTRRRVLFSFVPAPIWTPTALRLARDLIGATPDAIVMSAGLWTLWPTPFSGKFGWPWHESWMTFSQRLNQTLRTYRRGTLAPRRLLVTTLHAICKYDPPEKERHEGCMQVLTAARCLPASHSQVRSSREGAPRGLYRLPHLTKVVVPPLSASDCV